MWQSATDVNRADAAHPPARAPPSIGSPPQAIISDPIACEESQVLCQGRKVQVSGLRLAE
jgi:hypothetical protein